MSHFFCRKPVPFTLADGRTIAVKRGEFVEVVKATKQLIVYRANGSLVEKSPPRGAVVHKSRSE
jgi:hypothetical protein